MDYGGVADDLRTIVQGQVLTRSQELTKYARDASIFAIEPDIVVAPATSADIKALVRYVTDHPEKHLSITARAAGTDMSGGPLNTSIVLDMVRHMHHIGPVSQAEATAEPGTYYRDFEKATLKHGALMPSYPASRELCTVGGMVANNAGGEKSLTYGKTERYVKQLKVILADGNEYTLKPVSPTALTKKLQAKTFEGNVYRQITQLIKHYHPLIRKAQPTVSKNSTGYNLWNVWDETNGTFDLTQLFVGSQGTLGIINEITFRLVKPKPFSRLLVLFLKDTGKLGTLIPRVLTHTPESFESYDHHTLGLAIKYFPEFAAHFGAKNIVQLGGSFLPEMAMLVTSGIPRLVLLAEFTGQTDAEALAKATAAQQDILGFRVRSRITASPLETNKYWLIRRESFNLLRHHLRNKHTAPFIDDIVVAPEKLPKFLPQLNRIMAKYDLVYTIAGHIGDGNFHIIPLMDFEDPKTKAVIPKLSREVFELVFHYGGSMSGEHNDGLIRSPYLRQMYGPKIYRLFEEVKQIFDPHNIFNPGKKVHATIAESMTHFAKY